LIDDQYQKQCSGWVNMMIGLPTKSITKQEDKQTQQVWHIQAEEVQWLGTMEAFSAGNIINTYGSLQPYLSDFNEQLEQHVAAAYNPSKASGH
jgi:hypothetical protein